MPQLIGNSFALTRIGPHGTLGGGGGGGGETLVNAVTFDGSNDALTRGAALTGPSAGTNMLISFWFRLNGSDAAALTFIKSNSATLSLFRGSDDKITFSSNAGIGAIWTWVTSDTYTTSNSEWTHLLLALNTATTTGLIYVNDEVPGLDSNTVFVNKEMNFADDDWFIMEFSTGVQKFDGDIAEFYLTNEFLDLTVESNRRKFILSSGKPAALGANGSAPTGTQPLIYFTGPTVTWHENKGSGGGFTEVGALTDAANGPSD